MKIYLQTNEQADVRKLIDVIETFLESISGYDHIRRCRKSISIKPNKMIYETGWIINESTFTQIKVKRVKNNPIVLEIKVFDDPDDDYFIGYKEIIHPFEVVKELLKGK